uniref:DUF1214 domain-containing protein n=1 Tax=Candidatus Kentrum sp. FW TaxID=2126338 RepID=A0A450TC48_9GAMM|nr:MAG: Protein of unknown function (DUF1214) [Candidatus Kentron sp. FW]
MSDLLQKIWTRVTGQMMAAGQKIDALTEGRDPVERAEGYRFLTRVMATMIGFQMEQAPDWPTLMRVMSPTRKFYVDNPDTLYHRTPIDPRLRYRVYGRRGDELYLAFCLYGANRILANLHDGQMVFHGDEFEVVLSAQRPEATEGITNWLPLDNGVRTLVTRQYFTRRDQSPATLKIQLLDPVSPPSAPTETMIAGRLLSLGEAVTRTMKATEMASGAWLQRPNEVSIDSSADGLSSLFATPDNQYVGGWYKLADDEMLVMEGRAPTCRYWSVQLCSRWLESRDYVNRQVILNHAQVSLESDGTFRIVVAGRNPGVSNWLDTEGNREGGVIFRWLLPQGDMERPTFRVEKNPLS